MNKIIEGIARDLKAIPKSLKTKMDGVDRKKVLLMAVPYIFVGYFCDKVAWLWRVSEGGNSSDKMFSVFNRFDTLFSNPLPSFYPKDLFMEEGVWTLSNVCIRALGSFKIGTYVERSSRGVIRGGYLYTPAYDNTGIYKINLGNVADVTLIPFGFTFAGKSQTGSGTCSNYLMMVNDLIIGWDFQVKPDDTVVQTAGSTRFQNVATPLFQYKEFLFGWGGNYGSDYRTAYLIMPYLASINNLGSAVVKNTDKTMKITYTLTEEP